MESSEAYCYFVCAATRDLLAIAKFIFFVAEMMAACKAKSVQSRVQDNNPSMHEMVLDAVCRCKDPTGTNYLYFT